jgi:lantibiotic leader peptide-processing serine protease
VLEDSVKNILVSAALVTGLGLLAACQESGPVESSPSNLSPALAKSGIAGPAPAPHLVVEYTGASGDLIRRVGSMGGRVERLVPELGLAKVTGIGDGAIAALSRVRGVRSVTRDLVVQWVRPPQAVFTSRLAPRPNSFQDQGSATFFPFQWNLRVIQADQAWATGLRGAGASVAILDSGIDDTNVELAGRVDHALSAAFTPNLNPNPAFPEWGDDNAHGTLVAAIVATNGVNVASVAPNAKLIAVKVLNASGGGSFLDVASGIVYAANVGADVLNLSLGAYVPARFPGVGPLNAFLTKAINYANGKGALVVVAAGNGDANGNGIDLDHDRSGILIPGQTGTPVTVSATGPVNQQNFDHLASYSNFGRSVVALAAPGGEDVGGSQFDLIIGPCSRQTIVPPFDAVCPAGNIYLVSAGTSDAAPHVSAVAALADGRFGGRLNGGRLRTHLEHTADDLGKPGVDATYSHGRVNALRAVTE